MWDNLTLHYNNANAKAYDPLQNKDSASDKMQIISLLVLLLILGILLYLQLCPLWVVLLLAPVLFLMFLILVAKHLLRGNDK